MNSPLAPDWVCWQAKFFVPAGRAGRKRPSLLLAKATSQNIKVDTPGIEPGASRMLSGRATITPCAQLHDSPFDMPHALSHVVRILPPSRKPTIFFARHGKVCHNLPLQWRRLGVGVWHDRFIIRSQVPQLSFSRFANAGRRQLANLSWRPIMFLGS